jgi:hypothetical protein
MATRKMRQPRTVQNNFIVRCEGLKVCGWQVRIPAWHPQGPFTKLFSDRLHGGNRKAKAAARKFRDDVFAGSSLFVPHSKAAHANHSTNLTGVVGVAFTRRHNPGRAGQTDDQDTGYLYWTACWSHAGMQHKRNFAVSKYGFIGAWEKAVELRQKKSGRIYPPGEIQRGLLWCQDKWRQLKAKEIVYPERPTT